MVELLYGEFLQDTFLGKEICLLYCKHNNM